MHASDFTSLFRMFGVEKFLIARPIVSLFRLSWLISYRPWNVYYGHDLMLKHAIVISMVGPVCTERMEFMLCAILWMDFVASLVGNRL